MPDRSCFFMEGMYHQYISKIPRRPYPKGLPLTSVSIYGDGRHFLDIPPDDPIWVERFEKDRLLSFLHDSLPDDTPHL